MSTVEQSLDQANPNTLPDMLRKVEIGTLVGGMTPVSTTIGPVTTATVHVHTVPGPILTVNVTTTNIPIVAGGTTPAAGEVAIAYSAVGVATLTFGTTRTDYTATQISLPADLSTTLAADSGAST